MSNQNQTLSLEWTTLQAQSDNFERQSLHIKLVAIALAAAVFISSVSNMFLAALPLVLWLQDAIWKTYQSRTETRLLKIEQALANDITKEQMPPFQFNCEFVAQRPGTMGLVREYFKQALRPTIAFPHAVLSVLVFFSVL